MLKSEKLALNILTAVPAVWTMLSLPTGLLQVAEDHHVCGITNHLANRL